MSPPTTLRMILFSSLWLSISAISRADDREAHLQKLSARVSNPSLKLSQRKSALKEIVEIHLTKGMSLRAASRVLAKIPNIQLGKSEVLQAIAGGWPFGPGEGPDFLQTNSIVFPIDLGGHSPDTAEDAIISLIVSKPVKNEDLEFLLWGVWPRNDEQKVFHIDFVVRP